VVGDGRRLKLLEEPQTLLSKREWDVGSILEPGDLLFFRAGGQGFPQVLFQHELLLRRKLPASPLKGVSFDHACNL
jgi:hypothetical protein